jgi:hypothetical protein
MHASKSTKIVYVLLLLSARALASFTDTVSTSTWCFTGTSLLYCTPASIDVLLLLQKRAKRYCL